MNDPDEHSGDPDDPENPAQPLGGSEIGIGVVTLAHLINQAHDTPPIGGQENGQNEGR
jgi:hypothetical protein